MVSLIELAYDILKFLYNGLKIAFDFLMDLPSFINSLISIIPQPFRSIFVAFSGIIIIYFIAKAVKSVVGWCI